MRIIWEKAEAAPGRIVPKESGFSPVSQPLKKTLTGKSKDKKRQRMAALSFDETACRSVPFPSDPFFLPLLPRKRRSPAGESVLAAFDSPDPQDRIALNNLLDRLQDVILTSRAHLEEHLQLFPDHLIQEARGRDQQQLPLILEPVPEPVSAFRAAERPGEYFITRPVTVDDVFAFVRQELKKQFFRGESLTSPDLTKRYLIAELAREEREVFIALSLDNLHRPIALDRLFYGTIAGCTVHTREVVKSALRHNATAVIFAHNHPSGSLEASEDDRIITQRLKDALAVVEIRVLDHIIVGGAKAISLAEYGYI